MKESGRAYDRHDIVLLRTLQQRGRATSAELSQAANLSESSCLRRVRQLEADGVIYRYSRSSRRSASGCRSTSSSPSRSPSQSEAALRGFEAESRGSTK